MADVRDRTADSRDASADARDSASAAQDLDVDRLLVRALRRDASAELRDRAADARDLEALSRATDGNGPLDDLLTITTIARQASWDRWEAGRDRDCAAADRADLIEALRAVVRRREAAASQRESGAWDRLESGGDRIIAGQDREGAADDRAKADRERDARRSDSANLDSGGATRQ